MTNRRFAAKGLSQDEINGATIMLLLNYRHGEVVDDFLADLARAVDDSPPAGSRAGASRRSTPCNLRSKETGEVYLNDERIDRMAFRIRSTR